MARELHLAPGPARAARFSPDGHALLLAAKEGVVRWDLAQHDGVLLAPFGPDPRDVAFTPDGAGIAVADARGLLLLGKPAAAAPATKMAVPSQVLAICGREERIDRHRRGRPRDHLAHGQGKSMQRFRADAAVRGVAFLGTGLVVATSTDGTARVFHAPATEAAAVLRPVPGMRASLVLSGGGLLDIVGPDAAAARASVRCLLGPALYPFDVCADQFEVPGIFQIVLAGQIPPRPSRERASSGVSGALKVFAWGRRKLAHARGSPSTMCSGSRFSCLARGLREGRPCASDRDLEPPIQALLQGALAVLSAIAIGCGGPRIIPLIEASGIPLTQTPPDSIPLEVVTRSTGIREPVPVEGTSISYGDVETSLGHAISSAAVPWAAARRARRPEGYQLTVELTRADASYAEGRMIVTLGTRATLRTREGRTYLAQTQANCRQAGMVPAEGGAPVMFACMERIGRDLAGWLAQVEPLTLEAAAPKPRAPPEP